MSDHALQRTRIVYSVGEEIKYISHLDLLRAWERTLRRAGVPLAYSQGFNPHPRIVIGMPLPVGCTGEGEEVDVYLDAPLAPAALMDALAPVMPPGLAVKRAQVVDLAEPALPNEIVHAEYRITLADIGVGDVRDRALAFMERDHCEVTFRRKTFDLRPLVGALDVVEEGKAVLLSARLRRLASGRIGRPDVLLEALDLAPHARRVHRAQIAFGLDKGT